MNERVYLKVSKMDYDHLCDQYSTPYVPVSKYEFTQIVESCDLSDMNYPIRMDQRIFKHFGFFSLIVTLGTFRYIFIATFLLLRSITGSSMITNDTI